MHSALVTYRVLLALRGLRLVPTGGVLWVCEGVKVGRGGEGIRAEERGVAWHII